MKNEKVHGYIRVSTQDQDLDNQKNAILRYANSHGIIVNTWRELKVSSRKKIGERQIDFLINEANEGDTIIITELTRIARSSLESLQIINDIIEKNITLIVISQNLKINKSNDIMTKVMVTMLSLFSEIERDFISQRTKQGLQKRKDAGIKLGRPKTADGRGKSKLDKHTEAIKEYLGKGMSYNAIGKIFEVGRSTMTHFCKKRGLEKAEIGIK